MASLEFDYDILCAKLFILIPLDMNDVNYETYIIMPSKIGECVS